MTQLMQEDIRRAAITTHERRRQRRQIRILHTAVRERRRQHNTVVPRPYIRRHNLLSSCEEGLSIPLKLPLNGIRVRRLGPYARTWTQRAKLEEASHNRNKVGGDRYRLVKFIHVRGRRAPQR